jgi:hypothetical protein
MYNVIDLVFFIKKNYKSIIIEFKNPDQIINLGGPWISDLYINGNEIENKIIIGNYLEDSEFCYFVKYFEISKKQTDNFFSIVRINKQNFKTMISKEKFERIFIIEMKENMLYYADGFHKNLPIVNKLVNFY